MDNLRKSKESYYWPYGIRFEILAIFFLCSVNLGMLYIFVFKEASIIIKFALGLFYMLFIIGGETFLLYLIISNAIRSDFKERVYRILLCSFFLGICITTSMLLFDTAQSRAYGMATHEQIGAYYYLLMLKKTFFSLVG